MLSYGQICQNCCDFESELQNLEDEIQIIKNVLMGWPTPRRSLNRIVFRLEQILEQYRQKVKECKNGLARGVRQN